MMDLDKSSLLVDSSPSKKFFVSMITKDVSIESCIGDLLDNSIDSAKKKSINKARIDINFNIDKNYIEINDNCGGMTKDIALNNAFKFGNFELRNSGSLGMYGIGMKRSLFKLGKDFIVESKCGEDSFIVSMNLDEWLDLKDENNNELWKFHYIDKKLNFSDGLHIKISNLHSDISNFLGRFSNIENIKSSIKGKYKNFINNGIDIFINNVQITFNDEILFDSSILTTYKKTYISEKVEYKIIIGLGAPTPKEAGWNIICNGRYIILNDKSSLTGWENAYNLNDDEELDVILQNKKVPAYHNDFARFRGYIIFDAENPNELPLNTTKDGIDESHPLYVKAKTEMMYIMGEVLSKLRLLQKVNRQYKSENRTTPDNDFKQNYLASVIQKPDSNFRLNLDDFKAQDNKKIVSIQMTVFELNKYKVYFGVDTNRELGEEIFKFLKDRVIIDEQL